MRCDIGNHRWGLSRLQKREAEIQQLHKEIGDHIKCKQWQAALEKASALKIKLGTQVDDDKEVNG